MRQETLHVDMKCPSHGGSPETNVKLGQMECALSFFDSNVEPTTEDIQTAVVGQFEIIDASHHAGKVVVWRVWGLAGAADNRENRRETLEAYYQLVAGEKEVTSVLTSNRKFRAACNKLEEVPTLLRAQLAHGLKQVPHTLAVHVEAMVRLDGIHQS